jgi:hypothetical protein
MIGPASLADWAQASLVAALLGGLGAACGWALREEQREPLVTARSTTQVAMAPVSTGPMLERAEPPADHAAGRRGRRGRAAAAGGLDAQRPACLGDLVGPWSWWLPETAR